MGFNSPKRAEADAAEERRQQAFTLRKAGASFRAIGRQLGVSECQAHRDIKRVLTRIREQTNLDAEQYVVMECERLDVALLAIAQRVQAGEIDAVNAWVRISESRRKLLGLDAPELLKVLGNMSNDELLALADGSAVGIGEARRVAATHNGGHGTADPS